MSIAIFAGPSFKKEDLPASEIFDLYPPVKYGDIAKLVLTSEEKPLTAIAIIDGYFHQTAAVWHKEILFALANGVPVYGASSMGALRAAELKSFGMEPHGAIASSYISGSFPGFMDHFEADDEVAFLFGPAELGYPTTLALVDVRWRLQQALEEGEIERTLAQDVLTAMKDIWYQNRTDASFFETYRAYCQKNNLDADILLDKMKARSLSLKKEDALSLIRHLSNIKISEYKPVFNFEYTQNWFRMIDNIK